MSALATGIEGGGLSGSSSSSSNPELSLLGLGTVGAGFGQGGAVLTDLIVAASPLLSLDVD